MQKENKLFKFLFPKEYAYQETTFNEYCELRKENNILKKELQDNPKPSLSDLMRETLGLRFIDFVNVDDYGNLPHPYKRLKDDDKKSYVFSLDQIYTNPKFKELADYKINTYGNKAVRGDSEIARHNAGIAIVVINDFFTMFEDAHKLAEEFRKNPTEFDSEDSLEIMPD